MATDIVRIGVIGTGGMGSGHCRRMNDIPNARLAAICDVDPDTLADRTAKWDVPGFATHTELLDSGLVDAVLIATPHYFHPPIAIDAFNKGIHVLSEKPLGVTVGAVDEMIRVAKSSGLKFQVMYQMRTEPVNIAAKKIIDSGVLGNIYRTSLFMGWYRSQAYYNSGGWRATWTGEGGGVLINQAPHLLDLFTWLGGLPTKITGTTRTTLHDIEVEDVAYATLEYANGATGYLYASTTEIPQQQRLEICGDKGKLMIDGSLKLYKVEPSISEFTFASETVWSEPTGQEVPVELPEQGPIGGHSAVTANFVQAILNDEPLIAPGVEGLNAVELINGIILSSKTGKPTPVPVPRDEYDSLLNELKATSREKAAGKEQRVTDPKFN